MDELTRNTLTPPLLPPCVLSKCTLVRSNLLIEFSNRDSCGAVTCKKLLYVTIYTADCKITVCNNHLQDVMYMYRHCYSWNWLCNQCNNIA